MFTIGTLILLRGVTYLASDNKPILIDDFTVSDPLLERHGIFSVSSITALVVFVLLGLFLTYTRWGREIYAIGGARNEAIAAGVPRLRPMVLASPSRAAAPPRRRARRAQGRQRRAAELRGSAAVGSAAALLGGISLYGGRGTVFNVALGVAVLSVVAAGLAARGSEASLVQLVTGALLMTVIAIEFIAARAAGARACAGTPPGARRCRRPRRPDPSSKGLRARDLSAARSPSSRERRPGSARPARACSSTRAPGARGRHQGAGRRAGRELEPAPDRCGSGTST